MKKADAKILWVSGALTAVLFSGSPLNSLAQNKMKTAIGITVQGLQGQTQEQQEKDDVECYRFAIQETDLDPIYVPGAVNEKALKAKPGAGANAQNMPEPLVKHPADKKVHKKAKRKKGEVGASSKRETKARMAEYDKGQDEKLEEYKKAYRQCMIEKGYAVE